MKKLFSLPVLCVLSFTLIFTYLSYSHLGDKVLWYDEAGQFFISKGLNHDSDPYAEPCGLGEVIQSNRDYNKDPGGFSVLLYFWSMLSDNVYFLRLLPFLFFVAFLYFSYRIVMLMTNDRSFAIAMMGVLLLVLNSRLTEVRAYSMELLGLSIAAYTLLNMKFNCSLKNLVLFSLVLCIFCTSRYAFILDAFAVVIFLEGYWWLNKDAKLFLKSVSFGLPLLLMVIAIYLVTTIYQNQDLEQMSYCSYLSNSPKGFLGILSILYYVNLALLFYTYKKGGRVFVLNAFTAVLSTVHFMASILGAHPWGFNARSISVVYVCIINCAFVSYDYLQSFPKLVKVGLVMFCISPAIILIKGEYFQRDIKKRVGTYEFISFIKPNLTVFAANSYYPTLRYLFEYGCLKDEAQMLGYPDCYIFPKRGKHNASQEGRVVKNPNDYHCDIYLGQPSDTTLYVPVKGYKHIYRRRS